MTVRLIGERVQLAVATEALFDAYWAMLADPEGRRLTGTHATFTPEQIRGWLATRAEQTDRWDLAATRVEDGAFIGEAVLNDVDRDNGTAGFRIALGRSHWGQGFGTEMTRLVRDFAFEVVGLHRVHLEVFAFNPRARRAYEKAGFTVEGRLREALHWDGERHDTIVMGMLATDPRP